MKNLIKGVFVFGIFLFQSNIVFATDHNYLPADVLLKQQQEKSALEYRLRSLENQYQSNPQISILSIDQRISEIQTQRDTEKEYLRGLYAQRGIANQLEFKLPEIDAKYQSQINSLNQQKQTYQSQVSAQLQKDQEVSDLKQQILEMQNSIDRQADTERQKVLDDFAVKQQKLKDEYATKEVAKEDYSKIDINELFSNVDTLSLKEASSLYQRIHKSNPEVAAKIIILYDKKYPNGKPGSWKYEEYLKSLQGNIGTKNAGKSEVAEVVLKNEKPVIKQNVEKIEAKPVFIEEKKDSKTQVEQPKQSPAERPVQEKLTVKQRVSGFFKRIFRIN